MNSIQIASTNENVAGIVLDFQSFQSQRGNIKYRRKNDNKSDFVHTLNGSGLATPRLMIALLESYQDEDNSIKVPKKLFDYFKEKVIK